MLPAQPTKNSLLDQRFHAAHCTDLHGTNMHKLIAAQEGSQLRRQTWRVWLEHVPQASHENEKAAPHNQVTFDLTSVNHGSTHWIASLAGTVSGFVTHQGDIRISDITCVTDQTVNSVNSVNFMKIREQRHSPSLWPWCMCQIAAARTPASHEIRWKTRRSTDGDKLG